MVKRGTDLVAISGLGGQTTKMPRWQAEQMRLDYAEVLSAVPELNTGAKRHAPSVDVCRAAFAGGFVGAVVGLIVGRIFRR